MEAGVSPDGLMFDPAGDPLVECGSDEDWDKDSAETIYELVWPCLAIGCPMSKNNFLLKIGR